MKKLILALGLVTVLFTSCNKKENLPTPYINNVKGVEIIDVVEINEDDYYFILMTDEGVKESTIKTRPLHDKEEIGQIGELYFGELI